MKQKNNGKTFFHGKNVLTGAGKEYSKVSKEVENNFRNWLFASNISEQDFMALVDRKDFHLTFWTDGDVALTVFHRHDGEIAVPLIWQKESGGDLEVYKTDAALLLMLVESKCSNEESKKKIKEFIRGNLVDK